MREVARSYDSIMRRQKLPSRGVLEVGSEFSEFAIDPPDLLMPVLIRASLLTASFTHLSGLFALRQNHCS